MLKEYNHESPFELIKDIAYDVLKPYGPANNTNPLSNFNIDDSLKDLSLASINNPGEYPNGPFYHVKFEMYDFLDSFNSELKNLDFKKLLKLGFKTFGCVLNTDTWSGKGKHWVCIFGNLSEDKIDVEYFNSSGNELDYFTPLKEWVDLKTYEGYNIDIFSVSKGKVLQKSDTECGMWCLCYILSRMKNMDSSYFYTHNTKDREITEMRKEFFIDN
jgi:hypothetical protein